MVRLVEYSDSSDEDERESWWHRPVGAKQKQAPSSDVALSDDAAHDDDDDNDNASSYEGNESNSYMRRRPKRVKSPLQEGSTTSSLPSYHSSSPSSSGANSPWSSSDHSMRDDDDDDVDNADTTRTPEPQAAAPPATAFGSPGSTSTSTFGAFSSGSAAAPVFTFGARTSSASAPVEPIPQPAPFRFSAPVEPSASAPALAPAASLPFRTAMAHDAFRSMKQRLAGSATAAVDSSDSAISSSSGGAAMTSVFGASAPSAQSATARATFRPYAKAGTTLTSARSASARWRAHREARRAPSGATAAGATANAAELPNAFANRFRAAPAPTPMAPRTTFVFGAAREDASGDARMASPTLRSNTRAPVFTFGAAEQQQPAASASVDTAMHSDSVEFTRVFRRQSMPPATPASAGTSAAPASTKAPVFEFGATAPKQPRWPFGSANATRTTSTGVFAPTAHVTRRRSLHIAKPTLARPTATSTSSAATPTVSGTSTTNHMFDINRRRGAPAAVSATAPATTTTTASSTTQFSGQATAVAVERPPTFVFGATAAGPAPTSTPTPTPIPAPTPAPVFRNPNVGASAQFPFGMAAPAAPFVFDRAAQPPPPSTAASDAASEPSPQPSPPRAGDFTFEPRRTEFTSPRRWSRTVESNRKLRASFRQKATLGTPSPSPPPDATAASTATDSPFGLHAKPASSAFEPRRGVASAFSAPADPFVTHVFQRTTASSQQQQRASPKRDFTFVGASRSSAGVSGATSTGANYTFGSTSSRAADVSSSATSRTSETPPPPPHTASRRILRAVRPTDAKRATDAAVTVTDADANADDPDDTDGNDWGELKRLGGLAYTNQRFRDAAELYRQSIDAVDVVLSRHPDAAALRADKAKLHANRAASLMMVLQFVDARAECELAIATDPSYTRAHIRLSRLELQAGDVARARASLATAKQQLAQLFFLNVDPTDRAAVEKLDAAIVKLAQLEIDVQALVDAKDWAKALKVLDDALALAPNSRALQAAKTLALFQRKKYAAVVQYCNDVARKHQLASEARRTASASAHAPPANTHAADVLAVGVDMALHWAAALHYQNDVDDALALVQALEHAAPCSARVIALKRHVLAMRELKHAANAAFTHHDFDRAIALYTRALALDPTHDEYCAVVLCNRAAAFMGAERFDAAVLDCTAALERKPTYARAVLRRARCYVALQKHAAALKDFDRYLRDQRRDASVSISSYADVEAERLAVKRALDDEKRERQRRQDDARRNAERAQRQYQRRSAWTDSGASDDAFRERYYYRSSTNAGPGTGARSWSSAPPRAAIPRKPKQRTHYDVLGVAPHASADELRRAYRKLALVHHPDKAHRNGDAERFKDMTAAYTVLSDAETRRKYDRSLLFGGG